MKKRKFQKIKQEKKKKKENKVERKKESHNNKRRKQKEKIILHILYRRLSATFFLCGHRKTNCYSLLASNFSCIIFEANFFNFSLPYLLNFLIFSQAYLVWE